MGKRRSEIDPIERYIDITSANRTERAPNRLYPPREDQKFTPKQRRVLGWGFVVAGVAATGFMWQADGRLDSGVAVLFGSLTLLGVFVLLIRDSAKK